MIRDNLLKIEERISLICSKINRDPRSITIVAVSKGRTPEEIKEVIEAGIHDIGENKVQEALTKYSGIRDTGYGLRDIQWHMVGHLQTNKVKQAVKIFDLIQSVDNLHLAEEIDKQAARINKIQDVLIEVKTSPEATKFGVNPEAAGELIKEITQLPNVRIKGLMTIALLVDNPDKARPFFKQLRELRDNIIALPVTRYPLPVLSMGMTDDYEVAIEEGADMVRLGRAIFD